MSYGALLRLGTRRLGRRGIGYARIDAERLLSYATGHPAEYLLAHTEVAATKKQAVKFNYAVSRRCRGEPLAYITKTANFHGHAFAVDRQTLIPRPETEQLVDLAGDIIRRHHIKSIVEIGTGTGAIALSLLSLHPGIRAGASDISRAALPVARANAGRLKVAGRLTLKHGDLLNPWRRRSFDLLVANLPYLSQSEMQNSPTARELKYEPRQALYGGPDGLDIYRRMFQEVAALPRPPRWILLEFGWQQADELERLAISRLPKYHARTFRDIRNIPRILLLGCK